ncbi:RNA polymerase sigma factor [Mucilaginibacter auburnensis]|uniref:DNA-directed RNA polymerase specialized sigma24 family protein n=1 Tax=Mucilaginibacter auburnensis TaxID=1457233 RepID=A0A2H9VQW7_9SPHI|nr:hypothetical protein [Mucilaginibacter auburnensis]PJJ83222.1 DNA-directed RNA polymerase specialized sigma24 family protein [Mucilaginibacter auburnensis]
MERGYIQNDLITESKPEGVKHLYNQYADKLLGYILAIVNNRPLAEDMVVKVFADIFSKNGQLAATHHTNTWSWLTALAQNQIAGLQNAANECIAVAEDGNYVRSHKYLSKMNDIQRLVFCGAYYHRKSIALIARETGLCEIALKLALKEAFTIIRGLKDED